MNVQTSFIIDARSSYNPTDEVKIIIQPSERSDLVEVLNQGDGIWTVNYVPYEIGEMQLMIYLAEKSIHQYPYRINVFDINQVNISNLTNGHVNQIVRFNIDTIRAGIGQLEVFVQDGQVLCNAISYSTSQFDVSFLPRQTGLHKIDIRFNGLTIPGNRLIVIEGHHFYTRFFVLLGSPFSCQIDDLQRMIVSNHLTNVHVGHPASFDICNQSLSFDINITGKMQLML